MRLIERLRNEGGQRGLRGVAGIDGAVLGSRRSSKEGRGQGVGEQGVGETGEASESARDQEGSMQGATQDDESTGKEGDHQVQVPFHLIRLLCYSVLSSSFVTRL